MSNLLFLLLLSLTSLTGLKQEPAELNYFGNTTNEVVINNVEWYETPFYKKPLISTENTESFETFEMAKETMKKILLNEELNYDDQGNKTHWFEDVYASSVGFSAIFDGSNKYTTNFVASMNWQTLNSGVGESKQQKINVEGINEYNYQEGCRYDVRILSEYSTSISQIGRRVYVFVYKDVTHDVLNPDYESQINTFIDKQAENLITKKTVFDSTNIYKPAPIFADETYAPKNNRVYSKLNRVLASNAEQLQTSDGKYYSLAYYNKDKGLTTYNYDTVITPDKTSIEANEVWSLVSSIEDDQKNYKYYICKEDNPTKEMENWKANIVAESETHPLFDNILKNLIDGSMVNYTIDVSNAQYKNYKSGDIKFKFKTEDKMWIKVTVEHTDHPDIVDEKILTSSCNWNLNDTQNMSTSGFTFATYSIPLLNAKYTFHSINSLGEYNSFSINITNAPRESSNFVFLSNTTQADTWVVDPNVPSTKFKAVDIALNEENANMSNISISGVRGDVDLSTMEIKSEDGNKTIGKRVILELKDKYETGSFVSFNISYSDWHLVDKCVYYLCESGSLEDSKIKELEFVTSRGSWNYNKETKTLTASDNVIVKVPSQEEKSFDCGNGKEIAFVSSYRIAIPSKEKVWSSDEYAKLDAGNYTVQLQRITSVSAKNDGTMEVNEFTANITGSSIESPGFNFIWVVAVIVVIAALTLVVFLVIRMRNRQSLKKAK